MTGWVSVVTALTLGGAFAGVSSTFNGLQRTQLDEALRSVAVAEAAEAPGHEFSFSDGPGPAANDVGPLTKYGVIYDEKGGPMGATPPFDRALPPAQVLRQPDHACFDFAFEQQRLRGVLVPVPGHPGKRLLLAASRDDLDGDERFLFRAMAVAFLVAVAWATAVAAWGARRLTRDHAAIAEVARRVAAGDLGARVASRSRDPEVAQLGADVDGMIEKLSSLMSAQQRFIAHAAHELRSPLTQYNGEVQYALRKERDAEGYKAALVEALDAGRRLQALADDLLALARVGASRESLKPVDLALVADAAMGLVKAAAEAAGVALVLDGPALIAQGRPGDLTRMLRNLLENAVAHSPPGGTVRVTCRHRPPRIEIEVADEGEGVPDDDRERIFEPFFRGPAASTTEGSGLGLGIARDIARHHGGEVTLASGGEGGAHFVVSLPDSTALPSQALKPEPGALPFS
jgi:two-component system heavy metal sensor histidine kinase CusS